MGKPNKRKIVLTGGHAATTAISVVEEVVRRFGTEAEIYWVGVKDAVEGGRIKTLEYEVFPRLGVTFKPIIAGRMQRRFTRYTIPSLLKIPFGFISAFFELSKIKPNIVLSFGGFASYPVVLSAWLRGIPVIIHEQTASAGRANRYSSVFAKKIAISRKTSNQYFPKGKTILTGNPIMTQITEIEPKKTISPVPNILIMGGSRGSQTINEVVEPIIPELTKRYKVVHITGVIDFGRFKKYANDKYEVFERIDPLKIDNVYREADIIIARAGANTVSEIISIGRPSILIPIPWSYLDEQNENAKYAESLGIARIIKQKNLSPETLLSEIVTLESDWVNMVKSDKDNIDKSASKNIVDLLEEFGK